MTLPVPELTAKEHAPYLVTVLYREDVSAMHYHMTTPCFHLRDIETNLVKIREGKFLKSGWTVLRVWLSYNSVELPLPLDGLRQKL